MRGESGVNGGIFRHSFLTVRRAKPNLQSKPRSRHALCFFTCVQMQMSRQSLACRWFAVRSRPQWSLLAARILARQNAPIGHFLRRADPPAVRSPAPIGSAAPGRHGVPFPAFVLLSPVISLHASGWHPLRRGGSVAPNFAPSVDCFGCHPHACAQGVFKFLSADRKPTP